MPRYYDTATIINTLSNETFSLTKAEFNEWMVSLTPKKLVNYTIKIKHSTYKYEIRNMQVPSNHNIPKLLMLKVYDTEANALLGIWQYYNANEMYNKFGENEYFVHPKTKYQFILNGFDVTPTFARKTRHMYRFISNQKPNSRSYSFSMFFDTTYARRIAKIGVVDAEKGENTEFKCVFCGETYKSQNSRHHTFGVRAKVNDKGESQYCCTKCFKNYVVTAHSLWMSMLIPCEDKYEDIPHASKEEYLDYLKSLSIEDWNAIIEKENLKETIPQTLSLILSTKDLNEEIYKEEEKRKAKRTKQ